jgi:hypothetical protein
LTLGDKRYDALFANQRAVAALALGGSLKIGVAITGDCVNAPREAGRALAETAQRQLGRPMEGSLIFTPGLSTGLYPVDQQILNGIRDETPRLRITGTGLSGGMGTDGSYLPGYAFLGDRVERLGTLLVAFAGAAHLGFSMANGMQAIGPGGFVTDAEGPFIRSINGRPAKEVVVELLGGDDPERREHFAKNPGITSVERGVAFAVLDAEGDFYWAHPVLFFTPEGAAVDRFHARKGTGLSVVRIDPESCMGAVKQAGEMLSEDAGTSEFDVVIAFSCALRGFTLGPEVAKEDIELRRYVKSKRHLGIVANGEIGCYRHGRPFPTAWVYALFGMAGEGR